MVAQKGRDLLLKIWSSQEDAFVTVAGLRARSLALNAAQVDVTHAESVGNWQESLAGAGIRSSTLSGSGIFKDAASDALVMGAFFDQEIPLWEVNIPDFGALTGKFQITSVEYSGTHDGELAFEMSLASAGAIDYVAQ